MLSLRARFSVLGAHDAVDVHAWPDSALTALDEGDALALDLGEEHEEERVFTGEIDAIRSEPDGLHLGARSASARLAARRVARTYARQSVADIVRDLAGDVPIDTIEAAAQLSSYSVDSGRSVWSHLRELAALGGCELSSGANGGLRCVPPGEPGLFGGKRLRFGADLIDWSVAARPAPAVAGVAAHGAGSEAGQDKWHWVLREPPGREVRALGGVHTREAAEEAGRFREGRAARAVVEGELTVVGRPELRAGDVVELADLPGGAPGPLRIVELEHVFDARGGFVTWLHVEGAGGGTGGLL